MGKVGSNPNYLLELGAALSLTAGAILAAVRSHPVSRSVLLLSLAIQVTGLHPWTAGQTAKLDAKTKRRAAVLDRLRSAVARSDGPVLADEYMALIPLDGRAVVYQPFELKQLADTGLWDERRFVEDLALRRFALILRDARHAPARWTPAQLAAMEARYEEVGHAAGTAILKPRPDH